MVLYGYDKIQKQLTVFPISKPTKPQVCGGFGFEVWIQRDMDI